MLTPVRVAPADATTQYQISIAICIIFARLRRLELRAERLDLSLELTDMRILAALCCLKLQAERLDLGCRIGERIICACLRRPRWAVEDRLRLIQKTAYYVSCNSGDTIVDQ